MDKKKIIYIGSLLILTVIVSITYFSYAFFTNRTEQRGKLNIVTGTLDYKIKSADLTNNSITLEANKSKQIEIEITSLNKISSKYELYYQTTASNIVVGYGSSNDTPTGTINSNGKKTVKLVIKNKSNSQATIVFGVEGGFISNELVLSTGSHITDIINNICNYDTGYVWNFPFDPDGDGQGQPQTFKVPCNGMYKIELWGASGGDYNETYHGGYGSYVSGNVDLSKDENLYIDVGEKGHLNKSSSDRLGGFNGGGGTTGKGNNAYYNIAGSGGGATDVATVQPNFTLSNTYYSYINSNESLRSRIMVSAGAGGGSYANVDGWTGNSIGGNGGGITGPSNTGSYFGSSRVSTTGTQVSGGLGGYDASHSGEYSNGGFGYGGSMGWAPWGGAGGGWYGGGSGGGWTGPGSGGSSYISGHTGCVGVTSTTDSSPKSGCTTGTTNIACSLTPYINPATNTSYTFTNTVMIDGAGYSWTNEQGNLQQMPNPNGGYYASGTGNTGNGHARITYLGE